MVQVFTGKLYQRAPLKSESHICSTPDYRNELHDNDYKVAGKALGEYSNSGRDSTGLVLFTLTMFDNLYH